MDETVTPPPPLSGMASEVTLREMLEAAQRFFACRDRLLVHAHWADPPPVRTLAEAIDRDFAGFDMERAEAEFRAALAALSQGDPGLAEAPAPVRAIAPDQPGQGITPL